ncbi:uncharacterized protein LOC100210996 [Hydra vulgaris]|uniref:uncharacterized protein LOC100210996 n=1 Tax=Hydra vulgaris TaxID=6087 RepID=UPI0002B46F7F|nr:uncharacterized protein LOC100210996 [Hydra vulgaris]
MRNNLAYLGTVSLWIFAQLWNIEGIMKWPSGSYGLPRPVSGCPQFWKEGLRYHDTEDNNSNNKHSVSLHLSGTVNEHGVRQEFCLKEESLFEEVDTKWPDGQYCIYKYGESCPKDFTEGWVFWDDENQEDLDGGNTVKGFTPEGVYELDTLIYYCCIDKGNKNIPIELPLDLPFFLIAYKSKECQAVLGTTPVLEYIEWDDEDQGNTNAHSETASPFGVSENKMNTKIYYCYYNAGGCGRYGGVCRNTTDNDSTLLEGQNIVVDDQKRSKKATFVEKTTRHSVLAVAIGCSVAGAILGTAAVGIFIQKYLNKKNSDYTLERSLNEDEIPRPDHIW